MVLQYKQLRMWQNGAFQEGNAPYGAKRIAGLFNLCQIMGFGYLLLLSGCAVQKTAPTLVNTSQTSFTFGEGDAGLVFDFGNFGEFGVGSHSGTILRRCDTDEFYCAIASGWLLAPKTCNKVRHFVRYGALEASQSVKVTPIAKGRTDDETIFQGKLLSSSYNGASYSIFQGFVYDKRLGIVGYIFTDEAKTQGPSLRPERAGLLRETRWITNAEGLFPCSGLD